MHKIFFPAGRPARVADALVPVPGPGQLLVRTEAVGVGVGLVRMLEAGDAVRPGGEMVGTVVAAGPDVAGFDIGDRVGGVVFEDVYAEIVLAGPRLVGHVPAEVDAAAALALVRGGLIALSTLDGLATSRRGIRTGHRGGQRYRAPGRTTGQGAGAARVVAAVGSADKAGFVRQCGADEVVTYSQPSWGDPVSTWSSTGSRRTRPARRRRSRPVRQAGRLQRRRRHRRHRKPAQRAEVGHRVLHRPG